MTETEALQNLYKYANGKPFSGVVEISHVILLYIGKLHEEVKQLKATIDNIEEQCGF